jgi:hypothetical protein
MPRTMVGLLAASPTPSPSSRPIIIRVPVPVFPHQPVPVRVVDMPGPGFWTPALTVVSTAAAVLALFIAAAAYRKVADERRTVFELEILHDLLPLAAGGSGSDTDVVPALMDALPIDDLPTWRKLRAAGKDVTARVAILDEVLVPPNERLDLRERAAQLMDLGISISSRTRRPAPWWRIRHLWGPVLWLGLKDPVKAWRVLRAKDDGN